MNILTMANPQQLVFSIRTIFHADDEPPFRAIIDESLESNVISQKCRRSLQQLPVKSVPLDPKRHIRDSYGTTHTLTEQVELGISRDGSTDTEQDWFMVSLADNLGPSDAYDVILGGKWKEKFERKRLKKHFSRASTTYRDFNWERERAGALPPLKSNTRLDTSTRTNDLRGLWNPAHHFDIPARRTSRWSLVEPGFMIPPVPEEEVTRKGKKPIHREPSPLHGAVQHWVRSISDEQENIDVNSLENGWAPLHKAVLAESESMVHSLLDRGADLSIRGDFGRAPIHLAIQSMSERMVCLLSDKGANVNIPDENGRTPLHYAVLSRAGGRMAKLLMDYDADPLRGDNDGITALHYAAMQDSKDCFRHITQHRSFSHHAEKRNPPTGPFIFLWDLPEGVLPRPKHDVELNERVLLDTVTLTKGADSVKINSCQSYVQETYGDHGVQLLNEIARALHADDRRQSKFGVEIEASKAYIRVTGSSASFDMTQMLTWLCLAVRRAYFVSACLSTGTFYHDVFVLDAPKIIPREAKDHSCWFDLFESPLIAVEPGVHLDSDMSLRTSFEMMLMITAVEYPLMVDSGLVLMGYSTALVPMKDNDDSIVWHLEVAKHDRQLTVAELVATKAKWLKLDDLKQLSSRQALLGWCPNATVTLGTNLIDTKAVGWSDAAPKKTTWHWAGANLQLLAQSAAPLQIGGQLGISVERRVNVLRFSPLNNYLKCLSSSAAEQIILYDLTTKRAWLVPLLAAFHHMLTAYWRSIPENCRQSPIPQADSSPQCDLVLRELLKNNGDLVLETSPSDKCTMRDLIMGFSVNMSKISIHPPRGSEVYGHEFMDIVMDSPLADLKKRKVEKQGLGWTSLLSEVRCLFCSNLGDAIIGGRANEASAPCNRLIEGFDLLAATMRSIELLCERAGTRQSATAPICRLSAKHIWHPTGDPFTKCNHNDRSQSTCWNMMNFMQEVQAEDPDDSRSNSNAVRLCQNGAVVFGRRQAQIRFGRRATASHWDRTEKTSVRISVCQ